jgi:hypothetical protein
MWLEENPPHHLKLLPKGSCGEATIIGSHAPTLLFHLCARLISGGSYSLWPMRLRNCFLGAYKLVSSFLDVVSYSRRPSHEHAGSSCLLHINTRSRPMSLSIDDSLSLSLSHTHTNSQPCEDERNQRHDILDATSSMQHDHTNRYLPSARSQLRVVLTRTQEWE